MLVLIRQAKIVDPQSEFHNQVVDILIEDGIIKTIDSNIKAKADTVVEADGLHVSQGWVDIFADYREPGFEQKETIATGLKAAAAGGFTDVLLVPNTNPALSNQSTIRFVLQKAKGHHVNLHPLGTVTQNAEGKDLSEMLDMQDNGAVAFTDGWKPIQNANLMLKALEYAKSFNGTIVQLPVDAALSAGGLMNEGPVSTRLGMAGIPALAETLMIHRDIELLRYTESKLHITGVSTAAGVEMIRKAKGEGLSVTCSVTPYHLALNDEVLQAYSSLYKVSPPLRGEADRKALIGGLKDGTIDCITSHHRPQEWDAKAKEFEYASDGMNVQEIAFNIAWDAVHREISIEKLVEALSNRPRKIFNLPITQISIGKKAELTIFTIAGTNTLEEGNVRSTSKNNPFIGKALKGKVIGIINQHTLTLNK
ncbi:MAG TPA: dihydroorotase [Flavipsychrobacter sp.]|nr:dihydroorotase [Flavipsychrobacter sp.]